jgi:hypothetical protein
MITGMANTPKAHKNEGYRKLIAAIYTLGL